MSKVTKTYFHVNQNEFDLPLDFVSSKNDKYIVVQYCACTYKQYLIGDVCLHSNLVQRDDYLDSFIMLANKRQTRYRKYKYIGSQRKLRVWFSDIAGNEIVPDAFILSMLLIY